MAKAGTYNVLREYHIDGDEADDLSSSPHWVLAVVRLGKPLSYSRANGGSISLDVTQGARTRGNTLVITSDCLQLHVSRSKDSHVKNLSAVMIQSHTNYLVEILPGDWVLAWMVHNSDEQERLVDRIQKGEACNGFDDGWKFLGRVDSIRKRTTRNRKSGTRTTRYSLRASAFAELDTSIYYDEFLSENSVASQNLGRWLSRVGLDIRTLFATEADQQTDNVHILIPAFIELLLGVGIASLNTTDAPELRQVTGGGTAADPTGKTKTAPFAYLVPKEVGDLIGKVSSQGNVAGGIMSYADVLDVVSGVQRYSNTSPDQAGVFVPDIDDNNSLTKGNHFYTGTPLAGAFLPYMPSFNMRPLWSILNEYLNPVMNEMYTALRVNAAGTISPTLVLRQIPLTTDALVAKFQGTSSDHPQLARYDDVPLTPFSSLPRWIIPAVLVDDADVGRSNATRCNFVHVYGQDADNSKNIPITDQIVNNPPFRDDFDIQRSGLHPFMTTIACRAANEIGTTPSQWMEIIADHRIGSQFTVNGTLVCRGIRSPICEGDNLEFDGVIYHIESVEDSCHVDGESGMREWTTTITLTNGLRKVDGDRAASDVNEDYPIYPGFNREDNTAYDPGHDGDSFEPPEGVADGDDLENEAEDSASRFDSDSDSIQSPFNPDDDGDNKD